MRKGRIVVCCIAVLCLAGLSWGEERASLKDKRDRTSYAIGVEMGRLLKQQSLDVNLDIVQGAMKDVFSGGKLLLSDDEMTAVKAGMEADRTEGKDKQRVALAEKNRKEEEKFLAENKTKEGVVTLPSGLQYKVIKAGTGKTPKEDDLVSVRYRVSLIDGTEIENSHHKSNVETFDLENVVVGWRQGARLMQEGAQWRLFVPSHLAYGEDGVGELLGPNTTLIFDLELVAVLDKPREKPAE
jgi:FKBP-type peptidyl-prolyl cis-trans isomerase